MSEIEKAIETLKAENELILFDPNTGEVKTYDHLNEFNQDCYTGHIVAISALEKQVPKKPTGKTNVLDDNSISIGNCPCCEIGTNSLHPFCHNCGQALDWSE